MTTCLAMKLMCTKMPGEPSLTKHLISGRRTAAAIASQEAGSRQRAQASWSRSQPGRSHQLTPGHGHAATKLFKGCPASCFPTRAKSRAPKTRLVAIETDIGDLRLPAIHLAQDLHRSPSKQHRLRNVAWPAAASHPQRLPSPSSAIGAQARPAARISMPVKSPHAMGSCKNRPRFE